MPAPTPPFRPDDHDATRRLRAARREAVRWARWSRSYMEAGDPLGSPDELGLRYGTAVSLWGRMGIVATRN